MNREQILAATGKAKCVSFNAPDWGQVWIKEWSGMELNDWDRFVAGLAVDDQERLIEPIMMRAKAVQMAVCSNETGDLMFKPEDLGQLIHQPGHILEVLYVAIVRVEHIDRRSVQKEVDDFFAKPADSTGTGSRGTSVSQT